MDITGQGFPMTRIEDDRLIQNNRNLPFVRRTFWGIVTAGFWLVYVYLWLPLITLLMWYLGVRQAQLELYLRHNTFDPYLLVVLPLIALLTAIVLVIWAEYNRKRFGGDDRRSETPPVGHTAIVCDLGGSPEIAEILSQNRVCVLQMNDNAVPIGVLPLNDHQLAQGSGAVRALPLKYRHIERADHEPASIQQPEPKTGTLLAGNS